MARVTAVRYYNCACSLAVSGEADKAFGCIDNALRAAKEAGAPFTRRMFETDMDIRSLRQDPRFDKVMQTAFGGLKPVRPRSKPSKGAAGGKQRF